MRWSVASKVFSETFRTKALADHYRTKLMRAARDGEEFDDVTGLPDSMAEMKAKLTWYDFALKYLAMKWPHAAPNTRDGINESLTSVTIALLDDRPGRPSAPLIRQALRNWAFVLPGPTEREAPTEIANTLHWITKASRPLNDLADPVTAREVLDSFKVRLDGKSAAAETVRRKRRTFVNALHYAVDLGEFRENPLTAVRWQKPKVSSEVDPRVVVNPQQALSLLHAVSYVGGYRRARGRRLVGLFACMYFSRPAACRGCRPCRSRPDAACAGLGHRAPASNASECRQAVDGFGGEPRRPRAEESTGRGRASCPAAAPTRGDPQGTPRRLRERR